MFYDPRVTLSDPVVGTIVFDERDGWVVQRLDRGVPAVRAVSQPAPGANGSNDSTALAGDAAVTLRVQLIDDPAGKEAHLRAFCRPGLRSTLRVEEPGRPTVEAVVRFAGAVPPSGHSLVRTFVAQWVIPSGRWESAELHEVPIRPGTPSGGLEVPSAGLEVPQAGLEIPSAGPPGFGIVHNAGIADAVPVLRLWGPFGDADPGDETVVWNMTTGARITLSGLAVAGGSYVEIDGDGRITLDGIASQSRRNHRDNSKSTPGFALAPGDNSIAFLPDTFAAPAQLLVRFRDAY